MVDLRYAVNTGPIAAFAPKGCRGFVAGRSRFGSARVWTIVGAICVASWSGTAGADAIKLGGFWIEDVSVQGVEYGSVVYFNRVGTELSRPIERVQGLKLSSYPSLGKAQQAIEAGNDREALRALLRVQSQNKGGAPWVGQWVNYLLIDVCDRQNMPVKAVGAYLELVEGSASPIYLKRLPARCLEGVSGDTKLDVKQRIEAALERLTGRPEAVLVQDLLDIIDGKDSGDTGGFDETVLVVDGAAGGSDAGTSQPENGAGLTLPRELDIGNPVTQLLINNRFEQALAMVDEALEKDSRHMAMRLYQRGMAQMQLAGVNQDQEQYLDAGMSFARVLAYFPQSAFAGPSLVEAGVIHSKIGRRDIAQKLYQKATEMIDAEIEPRYAIRLDQLKNDLERQGPETNNAD